MDLREFYQEVILDHNRNPRHRGVVDPATGHAEGYNPICGDLIRVTLREADGRIADIAFDGQGCAISQASASLMADHTIGQTPADALALFQRVQAVLTNQSEDELPEELGALVGVRALPVRIKCALLPWHALKSALSDQVSVQTED